MDPRSLARLTLCGMAAGMLPHAGLLAQQAAPPQTPSAGERRSEPIAVEQLSPDLYWVRHAGFALFLVGDKGVVMFDTGRSPAIGKQILDAIAKVTPKPVNALILTHGDGDHIDGISALPSGVRTFAQENTTKMLQDPTAELGPQGVRVPADHLPTDSVDRRKDITLDGAKMQLLHWAPAHTSGDLVIFLPEEKTVLVGDVLVMDQHGLPLIHQNKGGTSRGWVESVEGILALPADRYVIGHEAVVGRNVIEQQLQAAMAERQKVKQFYDQGMSLEQIEKAVGDPVPETPGVPHLGPHFPPFAEVVYRELKDGTY